MTLREVYYIQTNLICIILILFILYSYTRERHSSGEAFWFKILMAELLLYCSTDIGSAICGGKHSLWLTLIMHVSNAIYVALPLVMAFSWERYIMKLTGRYGFRSTKIGNAIQVCDGILFLLVIMSPITKFAFEYSMDNVYKRNFGAYLVPLVSFVQMAYVSWRLYMLSRTTESVKGREQARVLILFFIPVVIGSCIQVRFYGCTCAQVGLTGGMLIVYLFNQQNKISKDELTGLNNRREFEFQIGTLARNAGPLMVGMVDLDCFKRINDSYGHGEGDYALQQVARALLNGCNKINHSLFVSRYGGDEFVFIGKYDDSLTPEQVKEAIYSEIEEENKRQDKPYRLSVSIGVAHGQIENIHDIRSLIKKADDNMYHTKNKKKGK